MDSFKIIDESFDSNISLSYFLSIRLNTDGLSFCTLDPVRNKYIQISHLALNSELPTIPQLEKFFSTTDILNLPFKKTFILIPTQIATLVPTGIFDPDKAKTLLQFCCDVPENSFVHFNKIRQADAFNIFSIDEDIVEFFKRQFPDLFFFHQNTPLIEGILSSAMMYVNEMKTLCINFNLDFFDLIIFEKSGLKFCNSFPIKSETDFLYYTLFTVEQLNLTESSTTVYISGINESSKKYPIELSRYFSKIKQTELPSAFRYGTIFKDQRISGFYDLLSLPLCVL